MKETDKHRLWNLGLSLFGITAAGLYFGLKRLLWRSWAVLSILWAAFWLLTGYFGERSLLAEGSFWLIVVAPPVLLLLVAGLLSWIIDGLRGDLADRNPSDKT